MSPRLEKSAALVSIPRRNANEQLSQNAFGLGLKRAGSAALASDRLCPRYEYCTQTGGNRAARRAHRALSRLTGVANINGIDLPSRGRRSRPLDKTEQKLKRRCLRRRPGETELRS